MELPSVWASTCVVEAGVSGGVWLPAVSYPLRGGFSAGRHCGVGCTTMSGTRQWQFTLDFIPPGNNHQYMPIGRSGQKALTPEAKELRQIIGRIAEATGFRPELGAQYLVRVLFVFPGWSQDIDSPIKSLLDAIFGTRADHRVVRLEVDKAVVAKIRRTDVTIVEYAPVAMRLSSIQNV